MIGIRLSLGHHPRGAELGLHGHHVINTLHWLKGHTGPVPVVGIAIRLAGVPEATSPSPPIISFPSTGAGDWRLTRSATRSTPDATGVVLAETTYF